MYYKRNLTKPIISFFNYLMLISISLILIFDGKRSFLKKYSKCKANFKEFVPWLKYDWFHLKWYTMFQDLSRCSIETGFWRI